MFTGQTAYCRGNPGAHAEETVKLRPSVVIDSAPHDPTTAPGLGSSVARWTWRITRN